MSNDQYGKLVLWKFRRESVLSSQRLFCETQLKSESEGLECKTREDRLNYDASGSP